MFNFTFGHHIIQRLGHAVRNGNPLSIPTLFFPTVIRTTGTVEPRFNEPLFNELLGITNNIFLPGKSYNKMYGTEPRFNELFDLTTRFRQLKLKIYLKFTSI